MLQFSNIQIYYLEIMCESQTHLSEINIENSEKRTFEIIDTNYFFLGIVQN